MSIRRSSHGNILTVSLASSWSSHALLRRPPRLRRLAPRARRSSSRGDVMSDGVKVVSLSLRDVGGLDAQIDLGPFGGGVSVISGRRAESAALVAALRAALFDRHDERHEGIKALQEQGTRSGPEIQLDLTL